MGYKYWIYCNDLLGTVRDFKWKHLSIHGRLFGKDVTFCILVKQLSMVGVEWHLLKKSKNKSLAMKSVK